MEILLSQQKVTLLFPCLAHTHTLKGAFRHGNSYKTNNGRPKLSMRKQIPNLRLALFKTENDCKQTSCLPVHSHTHTPKVSCVSIYIHNIDA